MKAKTKNGAVLLSSIAVMLVVVVLLNVFFGLLENRVDGLKLDMTKSGVYSLSDESVAVLESVEHPINIYYATNATNRKTGALEILSLFETRSDKIKVTEVNIDLDTSFRREYKIESYNSIVVECVDTNKKRVLSPSLTIRSVTNNAGVATDDFTYLESYVTSGIAFTQIQDPVSVSLAYGHGEAVENSNYLDFLMGLLYQEAMSVTAFDYVTDRIPQGTDIVLFVGPTIDFTKDDIKKLDTYMEAGGRAQFYLSPGFDLTQLYSYLEQNWNVKVNNNYAFEGNDKYVLASGQGGYMLPILGKHDITNYLMQINARVRIPDSTATSLTVNTEDSEIEATVLLTTSEDGFCYDAEGYAKYISHEVAEPVFTGGLALCAYVRKNPLNNDTTTARMLVSGSYAYIFDTMHDASSTYANKDFFVKSINFMSGAEEAPVSVASKPRVFEKMDPLSKSQITWYFSILIGVIPAALLTTAVVIIIRRKRL